MKDYDVIYGVHPVIEALRAGTKIKEILIARRRGKDIAVLFQWAESLRVPVNRCPPEKLNRLAGTEHNQGVLAIVPPFNYASLQTLINLSQEKGDEALILVGDGLQDPHNLGAIIRSAHAMGADGILIPKDRAVAVNATVHKASAGATAHIPICRVTNLGRAMGALFDEGGVWFTAVTHHAKGPLSQVDFKRATGLVVGSEGKGIRPATQKKCHMAGRIPLQGEVASLNASVAASIALYEVLRQRNG